MQHLDPIAAKAYTYCRKTIIFKNEMRLEKTSAKEGYVKVNLKMIWRLGTPAQSRVRRL